MRALPGGDPHRLRRQPGNGHERQQGGGGGHPLPAREVGPGGERAREEQGEGAESEHEGQGQQRQREGRGLPRGSGSHHRQVAEVVQEEAKPGEEQDGDGGGGRPEERGDAGPGHVAEERARHVRVPGGGCQAGGGGRESRDRACRLGGDARTGQREVGLGKVRREGGRHGGVLHRVLHGARTEGTLGLAHLGDRVPGEALDPQLAHGIAHRLGSGAAGRGVLLAHRLAARLPQLVEPRRRDANGLDGALVPAELGGGDAHSGDRARRGGRPGVLRARRSNRWQEGLGREGGLGNGFPGPDAPGPGLLGGELSLDERRRLDLPPREGRQEKRRSDGDECSGSHARFRC